MARNIHSNYFEDNYVKYQCQDCKKSFIVGEKLSKYTEISCPYCKSLNIDDIAMTSDESIQYTEMGCVGIYFTLCENGDLTAER